MQTDYSREERAAILWKLRESGLSLEGYSGWSGIRVSLLRRWQSAAVSPEDATWVEVELEEGEGGLGC